MAYTNFTNCTEEEYLEVIYSQDDKNRIKIWFNNVELEDAGEYCESLNGTNRILPNDGSKRFSLDNFVAKDYTLVLRDLPEETIIADQIEISIGTVVDIEYVVTSDETYLIGKNYYSYSNNNYTLLVAGIDYEIDTAITGTVYETSDIYEDVPIGIFNLQDIPTTDKNKTTLKLRDNRVKFDFDYNALPLIETLGGTATLGDILDDICNIAGVTNNVGSFDGDDIEIAIYDNSIKATTYVSYILEQGGYIPTIDRDGSLIKIDLSDLATYRIPLSIVEKYEIGTPYTIQRVVYESGIIKYESSSDETLDTLYLNSANPYIQEQEQIDNIYTKLNGFSIDSANTGKILGNPAIDPYDLIEIYDDEDENENVILTTFANNTYSFTGVHRQTFDTQIGLEERTENVSKNSEQSFRKYAKTSIDNIEGKIVLATGDINDLEGRVSTAEATLDSQGARLDIVSTNIDPTTGDVLELKRTGYELGANGLIIDDEQGYKAVKNTTGDYYYENNVMIGKYTKDGSVQKDLALFGKYYYGIDENLDVENFTKDDAMFVGQLYEDNNGESAFGHFFNGGGI